ncbi:adenylyl-sulfate reductase subunit alpha [Succinimonas sp.]|uniref:adenylyl-sulfate reductase subunit alpha n=1 Tax=Succinimonas sp. TaxID=1936151 RepID=UPI00386E9D8B
MTDTKVVDTDVLIIGGGTAGCYAACELSRSGKLRILIAEKAGIKRSGCLAAGVNALNAYITEGHSPEDYVRYAKNDAAGIARGDLLLSMARRLNEVTAELEKLGLVILRDENGKYVSRGWRNIKINGENIKPLLASAALKSPGVTVLEHVNLTDLVTADGREGRRAVGAVGFSVRDQLFYHIRARAVLIATGGAAGLYRPNNPGFSRHKMWYSPFNTGAGYSMGFRAGAELTTLEMRFIALRCKDTIAPVGTIAQGVGAPQINSRGEIYETRYGLSTSQRLYGTVSENAQGRGPCYLRTSGISLKQEQDLYRAYLNMAPSQTLKWIEQGAGPALSDTEIEGTEPYIVGGHTASGFWVDGSRRTTMRGLYAAGDAAGGCPQKYVTGCLAEAAIAAEAIVSDLTGGSGSDLPEEKSAEVNKTAEDLIERYRRHLDGGAALFSAEDLEDAMQKVMDQYAGGISAGYRYNSAGLQEAGIRIAELVILAEKLKAGDMRELLNIAELKDRLTVCRVLLSHLQYRHETRWRCFAENADYPEQDPSWEVYVNSRLTADGLVEMITRPLVGMEERYEHQN